MTEHVEPLAAKATVEAAQFEGVLQPGDSFLDVEAEYRDIEQHDAAFKTLLSRYAAAHQPLKMTLLRMLPILLGVAVGSLVGWNFGATPGESVMGAATWVWPPLLVLGYLARKLYREYRAGLDFAKGATAIPHEVLMELEKTAIPKSLEYKLISHANQHGDVPMRLYNEWYVRRKAAKEAAEAGDMGAAESLTVFAMRSDGIPVRHHSSQDY